MRRPMGGMTVTICGALVVAAGAGLGAVHYFGESAPLRGTETVVGSAAFGAVFAAPGLLAVLARRDRPALLLPAAIVLIPMSFISFALVTLPLLIPAALLMVAFGRAPGEPTGRETAAVLAVLALLIAAFAALFIHQDPRQVTTAASSTAVSDVVSYTEAAWSVALTTLAVVVGWRFARRPAVVRGG